MYTFSFKVTLIVLQGVQDLRSPIVEGLLQNSIESIITKIQKRIETVSDSDVQYTGFSLFSILRNFLRQCGPFQAINGPYKQHGSHLLMSQHLMAACAMLHDIPPPLARTPYHGYDGCNFLDRIKRSKLTQQTIPNEMKFIAMSTALILNPSLRPVSILSFLRTFNGADIA